MEEDLEELRSQIESLEISMAIDELLDRQRQISNQLNRKRLAELQQRLQQMSLANA